MTWVWTDGGKSESKVSNCTVGQVSFYVNDGKVTTRSLINDEQK